MVAEFGFRGSRMNYLTEGGGQENEIMYRTDRLFRARVFPTARRLSAALDLTGKSWRPFMAAGGVRLRRGDAFVLEDQDAAEGGPRAATAGGKFADEITAHPVI